MESNKESRSRGILTILLIIVLVFGVPGLLLGNGFFEGISGQFTALFKLIFLLLKIGMFALIVYGIIYLFKSK